MAIAYNQRTHKNGELRAAHVGQSATLVGWVNTYRDHGGMVFIDLRDYDGLTQLKFNPQISSAACEVASHLRAEDVIAVVGNVTQRGPGNVNPKLPTGEIEVEVTAIDLLSKAQTPPFEISDSHEGSEDLRLRYRFLDLRRPVNQRTFRLRHRITKAIRDFFAEHGFLEIETPFMTKSTPEGARDYLVPSRVQQGHFFALPQSPQLFKQLFMIAGFDRYAQIVRCFRDEDLRADRQPEFTQLDMEMAFVQADDVMREVEGCVVQIFKQGIGLDVQPPFRRMKYAEAMNRFGIDRPDLRYGLELHDVTDFARQVEFDVFRKAIESGGVVKCIVAKGGDKLPRKVTDALTEELKGVGAGGLPLTKVISGANGAEFSTGVAKFVQPVSAQLCAKIKAEVGETIFFMPGKYEEVCKYLHHLRTRLAETLDLIPPNRWELLWVDDFPLFGWSEESKTWASMHHPFTSPMDEDLHLLESEPGKVRAKAYDLVLNGTEMGGGSIRIHKREIQSQVFRILGIDDEQAQLKFRFLLEALSYGAPPHGGIAMGLDRWAMMLAGMPSLRDVIAFPKTQKATCPLTDAPSEVDERQLRDLGIDLRPEVKARLKH